MTGYLAFLVGRWAYLGEQDYEKMLVVLALELFLAHCRESRRQTRYHKRRFGDENIDTLN